MADGKRRYKSDRKDYKISVKLSEKDMDILNEAVRKSGKTVSEYVRELIRLGGNVDFKYPEDRARAIRIFSGIANNINQAVRLGNAQGELYFSDIDKLQGNLNEIKSLFGEVLETWRLQRS
jgi:Ribbon-helix-helix protein, copG family.